MLVFSSYLSICWVFVLLLPPHNRSPCLLMPGTLPGCHLMAGRDKRSSMETGKYSPQSHSFPLFQVKIYCLPALFFFILTASRSLHLVTQYPPSAATTWCTTGLRAWPSACTGTCGRGKRGWQTPPTRLTRRTEAAPALTRALSPGQSSQQLGEVVILRNTSLADSERNCLPVCSLYLVTSS